MDNQLETSFAIKLRSRGEKQRKNVNEDNLDNFINLNLLNRGFYLAQLDCEFVQTDETVFFFKMICGNHKMINELVH